MRRRPAPSFVAALAVLLVLVSLGSRAAGATEIPCELAEPGFALADGALGEWAEVNAITLSTPARNFVMDSSWPDVDQA